MSKHIAVFTATSAIALLAAPAMAQQAPIDDRYADVDDIVEAAENVSSGWQDEQQAGAEYANVDTAYEAAAPEYVDVKDAAVEYDDYAYDDYAQGPEDQGTSLQRANAADIAAPRFAYSAEQREEWLAQCRALRADSGQSGYYEDDGDSDGGLLGGILGAVTGGIIGNRVADGDRLAGTLIGAGLGGLAGAVVGSALDGNDDRYDAGGYTFDYCEAYLLNYERGYGMPSQVVYIPVTMAPVTQQNWITAR